MRPTEKLKAKTNSNQDATKGLTSKDTFLQHNEKCKTEKRKSSDEELSTTLFKGYDTPTSTERELKAKPFARCFCVSAKNKRHKKLLQTKTKTNFSDNDNNDNDNKNYRKKSKKLEVLKNTKVVDQVRSNSTEF